jgi:hypothetical protein
MYVELKELKEGFKIKYEEYGRDKQKLIYS